MVDVLLGFVDQPISDTSTLSWDTNKIGGLPVSTSVVLPRNTLHESQECLRS